jgi:hypothetical protein
MTAPRHRDPPAVYMPDNEPYLGRPSLLSFDRQISFTLFVNQHIAAYTRANRDCLSAVKRAACQIIPQGISLALSIRELIRQGYLFSALVLMRPLIERAAIISYILLHPDAVATWDRGWRFRERPPLSTMLDAMAGSVDPQMAKQICEEYGHIVHGDPISARSNLVHLGDGDFGYAVSKILNNPALCDDIAVQGQCYLVVLSGRMMQCFPEVRPPEL